MTPDETDELAVQISKIWPNTRIPAKAWLEPLTRLDAGPARATLRALRDTDDHPPSIARFLARHRELHTATVARLKTPCVTCDGTGWEHIEVQRPEHPHPTSGVVPCRCTNGRQVTDAHQRAITRNDTELARHRTPEATA